MLKENMSATSGAVESTATIFANLANVSSVLTFYAFSIVLSHNSSAYAFGRSRLSNGDAYFMHWRESLKSAYRAQRRISAFAVVASNSRQPRLSFMTRPNKRVRTVPLRVTYREGASSDDR